MTCVATMCKLLEARCDDFVIRCEQECFAHNRATTHTEFQSSCELAYGLASGVPEQAVIYFFINTAGVLFMMAYLTLIVDSNCPLFYAPPPR